MALVGLCLPYTYLPLPISQYPSIPLLLPTSFLTPLYPSLPHTPLDLYLVTCLSSIYMTITYCIKDEDNPICLCSYSLTRIKKSIHYRSYTYRFIYGLGYLNIVIICSMNLYKSLLSHFKAPEGYTTATFFHDLLFFSRDISLYLQE